MCVTGADPGGGAKGAMAPPPGGGVPRGGGGAPGGGGVVRQGEVYDHYKNDPWKYFWCASDLLRYPQNRS